MQHSKMALLFSFELNSTEDVVEKLLHQIGISSRVCAFVYCVAILYTSFELAELRSKPTYEQ